MFAVAAAFCVDCAKDIFFDCRADVCVRDVKCVVADMYAWVGKGINNGYG